MVLCSVQSTSQLPSLPLNRPLSKLTHLLPVRDYSLDAGVGGDEDGEEALAGVHEGAAELPPVYSHILTNNPYD